MTDMNGKVAVITGASSGIGRATAAKFAANGAKVVLAARREDELSGLVEEITTRGGVASFVKTDVSNSEDAQNIVAHTIDTFGVSNTQSITPALRDGLSQSLTCPRKTGSR